MKNKLTCLTLNDQGTLKEIIIRSEEEVDVLTALEKAKTIAKDINIPCSLSNLPKEALAGAGLEVVDLPHIYLTDEFVVMTKAEAAGCAIACCRHCDSYDEGSCFHWGGRCDADSDDCDRVHGSCVYELTYDGESIAKVYVDNKELSAKEVFDMLKADLQHIINTMNEDGFDFSDNSLFELTGTV